MLHNQYFISHKYLLDANGINQEKNPLTQKRPKVFSKPCFVANAKFKLCSVFSADALTNYSKQNYFNSDFIKLAYLTKDL